MYYYPSINILKMQEQVPIMYFFLTTM